MSDKSMAFNASDVLFNTVSVKRFLDAGQKCAKCKRSIKNWAVISICHHKICQKCINLNVDVVTNNSNAKHCPKCNVLYRPTNIIQNGNIKVVVRQIEEFVWLVQANLYGYLEDNFYTDRFTVREMLSNRQALPNKRKPDEHLNELGSHTKRTKVAKKTIGVDKKLKNITSSRKVTFEDIKSSKSLKKSKTALKNKKVNSNKHHSGKFDSSKKIKKMAKPKKKATSPCKDIKSTESIKDSVSRTMKYKEGKHEFYYLSENEKESDEPIFYDAQQIQEDTNSLLDENYSVSNVSLEDNIFNAISASTNINSNRANVKSNKSDVDVIYEKPVKLYPNVTYIKDCNLIVAITNLTVDDLAIYEKWASLFNVCTVNIKTQWDNNISHLIVKTNNENMCMSRTFKFLNALLSGNSIVNFEWILECINLKTLVPEIKFMVNDCSGEPSPMKSWLAKRNKSTSSMLWAKDCILYFHKTTKLDLGYSNTLEMWAIKAGFTIAHDLSEFKKKQSFKLKVILIDDPGSGHAHISKPDISFALNCLVEYKAICIYIDWYFECLFRFKFVYFEKDYQVIQLSKQMIKYAGLAVSMFNIIE